MEQSIQHNESKELLIEQYKVYVEMADRVSERRVGVGKLYISLLSGLLIIIPLILEKNTPADIQKVVFTVIGFLGLALCVVWLLNIRSYKQLNSLKFRVIQEMEQQLPFSCYAREWEVLKEEKRFYTYERLSRIEQYIPFLVMIPYIILLIYTLT